jgi:NADPH:quinone reductase-like Zn-dependent oxidoreductase
MLSLKFVKISVGVIDTAVYPVVKDKPPFSPGYDMVGGIDKLGEGTGKFDIGDRVRDLTVIGSYKVQFTSMALFRIPK